MYLTALAPDDRCRRPAHAQRGAAHATGPRTQVERTAADEEEVCSQKKKKKKCGPPNGVEKKCGDLFVVRAKRVRN